MTNPTPAQAPSGDARTLHQTILDYLQSDLYRARLLTKNNSEIATDIALAVYPQIAFPENPATEAAAPQPPAFDPLNGGCPHCKWLDTNLGRVLDKKCGLHQRIEDMQADQQLDQQVIKSQGYTIRRVCEVIRAGDDEDPVQVAQERMDEIAELDAAAPPQPVQGVAAVAVKPLEWSAPTPEGKRTAATVSGWATIEPISNGMWRWDLGGVAWGRERSQQGALKMLMASYEVRARSALLTSVPELSELRRALAALTDAFLDRHGCFPLDKTNDKERRWCAAMSEAYRLIGQPGSSHRAAEMARS
ncbi:hypothetical protein [Bosea massiliensis]|uniref:Uncharacterized protein n=1 Tax=Bosea massiliensis TaxID=151419 RepID=A0ABW0PB99_9HYPH